MCLEGPNDLEGLGEYPNLSISTSKEKVFRARANATEILALPSSVKNEILTWLSIH